MCKHRDLILSRINATINTSPKAPAKPDKLVEEILNKFDERREYVAQRSGQCSSINPTSSFYPGYTPEETDDGRLDRVTKSGFVAVDELESTYKEYVLTDEDSYESDDLHEASTGHVLLASVSNRSGGPASNRDYRREYDDRNARIVVEVYCASRGQRVGGQVVSYRPAPRSTSPR